MNHTQHTATGATAPGLLKQVGFTLIELSIVLVIIGLIVGGVLVGQDLIKAAEVRATIGQYEKYNAAINTFRTKYNGIPGDLLYTQANAFGLNPVAGSLTGGGDGNGQVASTASSNYNVPTGETMLFWQQLSASNLVDGSYGADLSVAGATATTTNTPGIYLPAAKMGRGVYWAVGSLSGLNYYALAGQGAFAAAPALTYAPSKGLTPVEAYNIDSKLDDGAPNTGIIQARGTASTATLDVLFGTLGASTVSAWTTATATSAASGDCITTATTPGTGTDATYARGTTPGNTPACNLRLRFN